RLGFCTFCIFRTTVLRRLDAAGIPWELAIESDEDRSVEALISADLAVGAMLESTVPPHQEVISTGSALPDLGTHKVNLYGAKGRDEVASHLAQLLRTGYDSAPPALARSA
ncbi:MAG: LysR family transcriptional regulator, partial [Pseudomonadota bacterium]